MPVPPQITVLYKDFKRHYKFKPNRKLKGNLSNKNVFTGNTVYAFCKSLFSIRFSLRVSIIQSEPRFNYFRYGRSAMYTKEKCDLFFRFTYQKNLKNSGAFSSNIISCSMHFYAFFNDPSVCTVDVI